MACRVLGIHNSMQVMNSSLTPWASSTQHLVPSLSSPQCIWLRALSNTLSTTTWATPSSLWSAVACLLESPPSSSPSQWVCLPGICALLFLDLCPVQIEITKPIAPSGWVRVESCYSNFLVCDNFKNVCFLFFLTHKHKTKRFVRHHMCCLK